MLSPIERQHQQKLAEQAAFERNDQDTPDSATLSVYDQMLLRINQIKAELKGIQSRAAKTVRKREVLPDFEAYVAGALTPEATRQDDVLMTLLIWLIDVGDFAKALPIAAHAIAHDWQMPQNFKRDVKNFVAEDISEWVNANLTKLDNSDREALNFDLEGYEKCFANQDLVDEVMAKFYKARGQVSESLGDVGAASSSYEWAFARDPKCGVKTRIKKLKKQIEAKRMNN